MRTALLVRPGLRMAQQMNVGADIGVSEATEAPLNQVPIGTRSQTCMTIQSSPPRSRLMRMSGGVHLEQDADLDGACEARRSLLPTQPMRPTQRQQHHRHQPAQCKRSVLSALERRALQIESG